MGEALRFHHICGRKVRHETKATARTQIEEVGDPSLEVYRCQYCAGYHVGHPGRKRKGSASE
jgi:hypothetical protein